MAKFKIQNISDKTIIDIIAINIDNENNVLIKESNSVSTISIDDFKDMVLGTKTGEKATYIILD
jgi:hypothetical protein